MPGPSAVVVHRDQLLIGCCVESGTVTESVVGCSSETAWRRTVELGERRAVVKFARPTSSVILVVQKNTASPGVKIHSGGGII